MAIHLPDWTVEEVHKHLFIKLEYQKDFGFERRKKSCKVEIQWNKKTDVLRWVSKPDPAFLKFVGIKEDELLKMMVPMLKDGYTSVFGWETSLG